MIELKNITYSIIENEKERKILNNISYKFEDGVFTAITGQNGSGKSTLTKIIIGILKPTRGQIIYNGVDITNLDIDERARMGINYAFQQPVSFKGITIKELIDIASGVNNTFSNACDYLSKVGICAKEYLNRNFDKTLSGGEQKRIELVLALIKQGNTYVFDEPEAGIDLWSFDKLGSLFSKNKTYIVVSHQEKFLELADKVLVLENGKIAHCGESKTVLAKLKLKKCKRMEQ